MLQDKFIQKIDNVFSQRNYLVKKLSSNATGTDYCNYHIRQAMLGHPNDFSGRTKSEIVEVMFAATNRRNLNHINTIKKLFKDSGMPIEISVGERKPFEIIYHDKSVFKNLSVKQHGKNEPVENTGYIPIKADVDKALWSLGGINVQVDDLLDRIEANCTDRGLQLKADWRKITEQNILKNWGSSN